MRSYWSAMESPRVCHRRGEGLPHRSAQDRNSQANRVTPAKRGSDQPSGVSPSVNWTRPIRDHSPSWPGSLRKTYGMASEATSPPRTALPSAMSGQHSERRLDEPLESLHQPGAVGAVDGAVVEASGRAHHRRDRKRVVDDIGPFLAGPDRHDHPLRRIDDRLELLDP